MAIRTNALDAHNADGFMMLRLETAHGQPEATRHQPRIRIEEEEILGNPRP
jgi:hypothetical protein